MRLDIESWGKNVFKADSSQEEIDEQKLNETIVQQLSQNKPVAILFDVGNERPEKVVAPYYGKIANYLENHGFDPEIIYKNEFDDGDNSKPMLIIKPRR